MAPVSTVLSNMTRMRPWPGWLGRHLEGQGGVGELAALAVPIVVSQGAQTAMMFTDRWFLSRLSGAHLAAAMAGGLTCFMTMTLVVGVIQYSTALAAQYLGAGRPERCASASAQALLLGLLAWPVLLALKPLGVTFLARMGHDPAQFELEATYFRILTSGAILGFTRFGLGAFFSGIGRTRVVMAASLLAMAVNIGANYVLIFGKFGFPALGMRGAAYGTVIGDGAGTVLLACRYFAPAMRRRYRTLRTLRFHRQTFATLLRFGWPAGVEFFLIIAAFNVVVQWFHSYGPDVATAVTITFNWDMVAFVPMTGLNIGVMSLVGRYMGARQPDAAQRAALSGLKAALMYSGTLTVLFLSVPDALAGVFADPGVERGIGQILPLAIRLVRLAGLYLIADAVLLVFAGALRGAGDTTWVMRASVALHWLMAGVLYLLLKVFVVPPVHAWISFVAWIGLMAVIFGLRFATGHWRSIEVVRPPVAVSIAAEPEAPESPVFTAALGAE